MFVLDTNVVSEMRKMGSGKANLGLTAWVQDVPASLLYISAVTTYELELGVQLAERRDVRKGKILRFWLETSVAKSFEGRILSVDAPISRRCASFNVPDPAPFRDAWIAATAQAHGMTVITRNVRDFERFSGIQVTNPWS